MTQKAGSMKIRNAVDARRFLMIFDHLEKPFTLTWRIGESRSNAQNMTIHKWFAEVATALQDAPDNIKAECNLTFGVPIMVRDDAEWASAFSYIFEALSRPAKLKAIRVLDIPFTRRMSVGQLSEYMEAMQRHYAEIGVRLTDPDAMKYREEME